ncbi:MAG: glycosyltransferase family 39 protein [Bacteroidales bacterium]
MIAILIAVSGFLLFHNLGGKPFRIWDESRLACNSLEMYRDGFSIVPTFDDEPDMWNTKPPLLIWIQTASIHLFGISEWSLRLPSALAGLAVTLILFAFLKNLTRDPAIALLGALIPLLSPGYLNFHNVRSADYDALLVLLTLGFSLAFLLYTSEKRVRHLYLTGILITLALLTKSTAALLPLPGLLIWALVQKKPHTIIKSKHFWISAAIVVAGTGAYYLLREQLNPGYLKAVDANEISGRFLEVNDGNTGDHWYYLRMLMKSRFRYWFWILAASIPLSLLNPTGKIRRVALWSIIQWSIYLLVISIARTKLRWYDLPAYPFMAVTIAAAFHTLFTWSGKLRLCARKPSACKIIRAVLILGLITAPLIEASKFVTTLKEYPWDEELYEVQYLLKDNIEGRQNLADFALVHEVLYQRTMFYLNHSAMVGKPMHRLWLDAAKTGNHLIVTNQSQMDSLQDRFFITPAMETPYPSLKLIRLDSLKQPVTFTKSAEEIL